MMHSGKTMGKLNACCHASKMLLIEVMHEIPSAETFVVTRVLTYIKLYCQLMCLAMIQADESGVKLQLQTF